MRNFIVIVFLLLTARAHGGVWYYGTGEAVNVENQIGFEKEKNVKILAEADDLIGSWFGNKLSLDPSRSGDNLLRNGDFENGIVEYSCTDATGAIVASTIPMQNSARMFQMTVTGAGGYCDFTATTGAKFEGLLFKIGGLFQTELFDVEYCTLVNGVEDNCIPVAAIADDATDPFVQPLRTQSQAGATSVGIRVKTTSSTSGVVNFDKLKAVIGELNTGSAISCNGDLDCENSYSAKIQNNGVASITSESIKGIIVSVNRVSVGRVDVTINSAPFSKPPTFIVNRNDTVVFGDASCSSTKVSDYVYSVYCETASTGIARDDAFDVYIGKQAPDFKTLTQQGVVNVGQAQGALVQAVVAGGQTIGTTATVFALGASDISELKGFSFNDGNDEFTALQAGKYELDLALPVTNGTNDQASTIAVQVDDGSGYVTRRTCASARTVASIAAIANVNCLDTFTLKRGDRVRVSMISTAASTTINANVPTTLQIRSVVDQQTIAASIIGGVKQIGTNKPVSYTQQVTCSSSSSIGASLGDSLFASVGNLSSGSCSFTINDLFKPSALPNGQPFCFTSPASTSVASVSWAMVWSSATTGTINCRAGGGECGVATTFNIDCKGEGI